MILLLTAVAPIPLSAQSITNISWATRFAAPAAQLDARMLSVIRTAVDKMGEESVVHFTAFGAMALGLSEKESVKLNKLLPLRYQELRANSLFADCPSQLAYCYSASQPSKGRANIYLPANLNTNLHPIVFLHGYGGSFNWYLHALTRACPERVIIAPAYGIQPAGITRRYLFESIKETKRAVPLMQSMPKPILIGLSAGGRGACQVYAANPEDFAGLVCVAAPPPRATWNQFGRRHWLSFICGGEEPYVKSGVLKSGMDAIRQKSAVVDFNLVDGGDHYFLLEFANKSEGLLRQAVAGISK